MNRESKFRGFSINHNKWVYGSYHPVIGNSVFVSRDWGNGGSLVDTPMIFDSHFILVRGSLPNAVGWSLSETYRDISVVKESVGMFTGLKDKNGKEIYEGDIVKRTVNMRNYSEADGTEAYIYEVSYLGIELLPFSECGTFMEEYEVIGNVCENPQVIK